MHSNQPTAYTLPPMTTATVPLDASCDSESENRWKGHVLTLFRGSATGLGGKFWRKCSFVPVAGQAYDFDPQQPPPIDPQSKSTYRNSYQPMKKLPTGATHKSEKKVYPPPLQQKIFDFEIRVFLSQC